MTRTDFFAPSRNPSMQLRTISRRELLKRATAAAAAVSLPTIATSPLRGE